MFKAVCQKLLINYMYLCAFPLCSQAAIWQALNHYAYRDAVFLAERLYAEGLWSIHLYRTKNEWNIWNSITFYDYQDLFILSLNFFLFYYPLRLLIFNPLELVCEPP